MMKAAEAVRYARAVNGLTRAELAALAGVAPSTIGRIESGKIDPSWDSMTRILEAAGLEIGGPPRPGVDESMIEAARQLVADSAGTALPPPSH